MFGNMDQRLHSAVFLGSLIATSVILGLSQYVNVGRGLFAIPATIILLISPDDTAAGPVAHMATLLWLFFCGPVILILLISITTTSLIAAWSLFHRSMTHRYWRLQTWIQIAVPSLWIIGLGAFDVYPVPQNPSFEQSALVYVFPSVMLMNAVVQNLLQQHVPSRV